MTARSRRSTRGRYEEAAHLQTIHRETKRLWPRRWVFFGPRVVPVSLWVGSLSKHQHTMDILSNTLRGRIAVLESTLARRDRLASRTQAYIEGSKSRLTLAENNGLSVAEFLELEHLGAREHRLNPRKTA